MRFPLIDQVALPVQFARYVPGAPHPDGRRYLPLLIFVLPGGDHLGVVDRHHVVDPEQAGRSGVARLVFLLSDIRLQAAGEQRQGIAVPAVRRDTMSVPEAWGQIVAVPSWEARSGHLPYDSLYTELLLDVGSGTIGVRTNVTADDLAAALGKPAYHVGDWIHVARSRVDVLGFEAASHDAEREPQH